MVTMRLSRPRLIRALRAFGRMHRQITAVYLFGSTAKGHAGPLSDIDVGVLFCTASAAPRSLTGRAALAGEVSHACRRPDVDVVVLNEAPPLLAYEVVRHGPPLYERHRAQRITFEAQAIQRYLDLAPFLATARRYLKRQLMTRSTAHG